MQRDKEMFSRCIRTCMRLCQQSQRQLSQQQQHQVTQRLPHTQRPQMNHVRAATTLTAAAHYHLHCYQQSRHQQPLLLLQRPRQEASRVPQQQLQQQPCNRISTSGPPLHLSKHPIEMKHVALSEDHARELIYNLKDSERDALRTALAKYDAMMQKEGFEGTLAATQWRTRFGRPSKVPRLGDVDPTGTFCAFPADWLKRKAAAKAVPPTQWELRRIFIVNAVPFIAFGFLDNFVMIVAGDSIESVFGAFMCISTMAAAGLGNTVSDVLGIGSAFYVERGCEIIGLRLPDLSPVQLEMKSSRQSANYGRLMGITLGCLLGMFPLLFIDKLKKKPNEEHQNEALTTIANTTPPSNTTTTKSK